MDTITLIQTLGFIIGTAIGIPVGLIVGKRLADEARRRRFRNSLYQLAATHQPKPDDDPTKR